VDRYCRNITFKEIGEEGQARLAESHAVVVGAGALGGTLALHMVRAGVGSLTICDNDTVDIHNIARQLLYDEGDVGASKLQTTVKKLARMNSEVRITGIEQFLSRENAHSILGGADVILDGTDRMEPRYVMNAFSQEHGMPYVYGGVLGSHGMLYNAVPGDGRPCLACIFPESDAMKRVPTCAEVGIVNTVPAIIASMQATEALKLLLGKPYAQELIIYDAWRQSYDKLAVKKRPGCPACSR
jgi:adenylyltransferase/sulfurtransferase